MADNNQLIVNYYEEIAESYDSSRFDNTYGQYVDYQERLALDSLNISPEKSLDLPCGTGRFLNYADYGCDASKNMVKIAASHWIEKNLVCADARNLPYPDCTFDTVITMHLLMHLDDETIEQIMKEVHRIPSCLRKPLRGLDYKLAQTSKLKEYSSYLIYELCKR